MKELLTMCRHRSGESGMVEEVFAVGGQRKLVGGGWLNVSEAGGRVRLEAVRPLDGKGLYKVWISGGTGGRMLLGTMIPCAGRLELCRTLSRTALQSAGCYPVTGGEAVMAFAFGSPTQQKEPAPPSGWTPAGELELEDALLRDCTKQCAGLLTKPQSGGIRLAMPYVPSADCPMVVLFCLARLEQLDGRPYLVWNFDADGRPICGE